MGFLLKKIVAIALQPLVIALLLLLVARLRRRHRDAWVYVVLAGMLVFGLSTPLAQELLSRPLEAPYPPYQPLAQAPAPRAIVVLSGGYERTAPRQPWDDMNTSTLRRTLEGVRLAKLYPHATLYLSGGDPWGAAPPARAMAAFAVQLGIPAARIRIEAASRDTHDQAVALARLVGHEPMLLVTSAFHMRRSMALFEHAGCRPIPAPTDYLSRANGKVSWLDARPVGGAMQGSEAALHEYLGLAWSWLRGQVS